MINLAQAGGASGGKLAIDATFQYLRGQQHHRSLVERRPRHRS